MSETKNIFAPVFNIQTYCIHDGPGIRTTVFVKGCPLRCLWCANPESQLAKPQLMTYSSKCTGCGQCISQCPKHAISIGPYENKMVVVTNREQCVDCGGCVAVCPASARELAGKMTTVDQALDKIMKDKIFYDGSGGGMTISGGEALVHPFFSEALFKACREKGVHTAIETCSFAPETVVDHVFAYVDLALLDIKHMDSEVHKKLTGVGNEQILSNIKHVYHDLKVPVVIRVPTIPGYNDSVENISTTAKFVAEELGPDVAVHLLPYHSLGESKQESLGNTDFLNLTPPSQAHMEELKALVESYGLTAQIGG